MPHILEPVCDTSNALKFHLFKTDLRSLDKTSADVPRLQKQWCRVLLYLKTFNFVSNKLKVIQFCDHHIRHLLLK